jgi:hypothetical protein
MAAAEDTKKPSFSDRLFLYIKKSIETKLKINESFKVQLTKGPVIFIILEGAQGDFTTMKHVRKELKKIVDEVLAKQDEQNTYPGGFDSKITSSNKGNDLWFQVEILYP